MCPASDLRPWGSVLARAVALGLFLVLVSCEITDYNDLSTSVVIRFDEDGLTTVISLDRPVRLPLDEDDALYIMAHCSCGCQGELVLVGEYWQYPAREHSSGCLIRIHIYTGDVDCFPE
ncbi:MAG TPA: hypothetical protein PLR71_01450 [Deltaproteobacteria bacterium]|nr:hypothetical protein [Deltaproteobacteria bacterium]